MIDEVFADGDSWLHRIDPRRKILFATVLSMVVAVSREFQSLTAALAAAVLLTTAARLPLGRVCRRLAVLAGFMGLIWAVLPFTYEGPPLFQMGWLTASRPGVLLCGQITLKSFAMLLIFLALIATMNVATIGHALGRLGVPDKIVFLLLLTYRYLFILAEEYQKLARAAKIRGFRPGTNLHSYRTYAYLIGMLFIRSWSRGERIHQAMRCRGFQGRFYSLVDFPEGLQNRAFGASMTLVLIVLLFLEIHL